MTTRSVPRIVNGKGVCVMATPLKQALIFGLETRQDFELELVASVNILVQEHWDEKIKNGIIHTELRKEGVEAIARHKGEMDHLANFEAEIVCTLLEGDWKPKKRSRCSEIHYFSIGTGLALEKMTGFTSRSRHCIVAYDSSKIGCEHGYRVFEHRKLQSDNRVLQADIEFAVEKKFMKKASKLILSRVLQVLDKQEFGWEQTERIDRKLARTSRRIGKMLSFLEVLIIHPCHNDNKNAVWGDSSPYTCEELVSYLEEGFGQAVESVKIGTVRFHTHIYTALLVRKKNQGRN